MLNYSTTCAHGYMLQDIDECDDCITLEVAKMKALRDLERSLPYYVSSDDNVTRALVMTAAGSYVSMKVHKPKQAPLALQAITECLGHALPAPPDERMLAQQQFLTELSIEARLPEELACQSFRNSATAWLRQSLDKIRQRFGRIWTPLNSK